MVDLHVKKLLETDLYNFLPEVTHFSELQNIEPGESDRIIITEDETHDSKRTMYVYDNSVWVYLGVVAEMPIELIITKDRNLYISDKDRKPMKIGDLLCYDTYNQLLTSDPAIQNKLYLLLNTSELYHYNAGVYKKIGGEGGSSESSGLIFNTTNELNNYLSNETRVAGMIATCLETDTVLYVLSNDRNTWNTIGVPGGSLTYLFNSEIW